MKHFIVFMLFIYISIGLNEAFLDIQCPDHILDIRNQLGPGKILQSHGRSKDNDLGVKNLVFNTSDRITFGEHIIPKKTEWRCIIKQGIGMKYYADFEAYKGGKAR